MSQTTEHDANPLNAAKLIEAIDKDRRLAREVLTKLPQWVRAGEDEDITFEIEPDVTIPSLGKLKTEFALAGQTAVGHRLANAERQLVSVIGETVRLGQMLGKNRLNPSWSAIDLMESNADGDTQNPLYSAAVDGGLRFAPDAIAERRSEAKVGMEVSLKNNWLTAKYNEVEEWQTTGSTYTPSGLYDALMRNKNISYVTAQRSVTRSYTTTSTYTQKFGGYYQWQTIGVTQRGSNQRDVHQQRVYVPESSRQVTDYRTHYYTAMESYQKQVVTYTSPEVKNIAGDRAIIAQTFYLPTARVILATKYQENQPQNGNIEREFFLCRCENGAPDLQAIIAKGEAVINGNGSSQTIQVNWDKPVLANAHEQLAFVLMFKGDIKLCMTSADNNRTGQLLCTHDYFFWEKMLFGLSGTSSSYSYIGSIDVTTNPNSGGVGINQSIDLNFGLVFAQFQAAEQEILMPNFELAGGISTAKVQISAQMPMDNSAAVNTLVKIAGEWQPMSVLNNNISLPPSTEAKIVLKGTTHVMPIIDTERSTYTLFRPKNALTFVSKPRIRPANGIVKLAMEIAGFDSRYHQADVTLLLGERQQVIQPTLSVSGEAGDQSTSARRYEFQLPAGGEHYRIKVSANTANASVGFDISSIVELH